MQTQLIHGSDVFKQLKPEWDELVCRSMTATPFQSLAYQRSWWTHLGPGDLHTIAVRGRDGTLVAIACFYSVDDILHFNGCVEETDYLDLISSPEDASAAWSAVFDRLEDGNFPPWKGLNLCNVPAGSPSRGILEQLAGERGYSFQTTLAEVCPVVPLPESFDDYLKSLDGKQRREIRRKLRRAKAASVELVAVNEKNDLEKEVDDFLELLQASTQEKEDWLNDGRRAVFHEVAAAALEAGMLQLLFLQVQGKKAAALYNFDYKGRIWVYNSGFNFVEFGYLSPGVVLTARAIENAIGLGRRQFDFLRGNETYKYRFGAQDTTIHDLQIRR